MNIGDQFYRFIYLSPFFSTEVRCGCYVKLYHNFSAIIDNLDSLSLKRYNKSTSSYFIEVIGRLTKTRHGSFLNMMSIVLNGNILRNEQKNLIQLHSLHIDS